MMYVALGDGGAAADPHGNGQNLETLLGKILRIDVRGATAARPYRVPADNPFAGRGEGVRGEIWAYGLRNPWRIAFDRENGDLWCGDVGQDRIEEVDRIVRGGNYGWNLMEGDEVFGGAELTAEQRADLVAPIATYPRREGASVTGGHVYRGEALPELRGRYLYADFVSGNVWGVREDRDGGKHDVLKLAAAGPQVQIASFAELPDGEVWLLGFDGRVHRLARASRDR
jgi:glucose/arabinose dehydrogenase